MTRGAAGILLLFGLLAACGEGQPGSAGSTAPADDSAPAEGGPPVFRDVTAASGIAFVHRNGRTPEKRIPETMGSGVAVLDADGDGLMDIYFVDSGPVPGTGAAGGGGNRLYRNLGGLCFRDVTEKAGVAGRGFGMGAAAADYDADGDTDLYVTCLGSNILYRNNGDSTFTDVTAATGADDPRWSTGAAFLDFDSDGRLDLFVQNYVVWGLQKDLPCHLRGVRVYCQPDIYDPDGVSLFRNRGDGTFENATEAAGLGSLRGKGLAVGVADLDNDGRPDIYCANDLCPNFLLRNTDGRRFEDLTLTSGAGYSEEGREEAGMGVDMADLDGDGLLEIIVSNYQGETNAIYRNDGAMLFTEISRMTGTAETSLRRLGFGIRFLDYDSDGIDDIVVANGHIYDNAPDVDPQTTHAQPPTLYRGLGGLRFADVTGEAGKLFPRPRVGRGLATADLDNDGDEDLILTQNGGTAVLFENAGGNRLSWIGFRLEGTRRDRTAVGARVTIEAGGRTRFDEVRSAGSYLSQGDLRLVFGLGDAGRADRVIVRWPDGSTEEARDVPARSYWTFIEGRGLLR